MNRLTLRRTLVLALGAFALFVILHWHPYFEQPFHEQGDLAANALQIDRCKDGVELYGNYSRFRFNHPGPAFFYVYALGELVLHDWLGVVPSPHNAHLIVSMALQSLFFALALAIFQRHVRTMLFVPLALVLAAVHYGGCGYAFTSLWAPHFPLMPFLCLVVASASVACGVGTHLPAVVLAGGFLVHGHVAQPLFAVSLFVAAWLGLWWRTRRDGVAGLPWRAFPRSHALAGTLLALFLLPLVIDWLQWPEDNLARIMQHLRFGGGDHKPLDKSLLYLLSFFTYRHDQDVLLAGTARAAARTLLSGWPWFAGWALVFGFVAWRCCGRRSAGAGGDVAGERGFLRCVALFWLGTALLCVVWGVMQAGPMFEFNGHFYFSLLFVPLLMAAAALARWIGPRPGRIGATLLVASAIGIASRTLAPSGLIVEATGVPLLMAAHAAYEADPKPAADKVLVMGHGDRDWPTVVGVMIAMVRHDIRFQLDPMWGFAFGRYRALPSQVPTPTITDQSIWRFVRRAPADVGVPFVDGLRIVFEPGRIDPAAGTIDCGAKGDLESFHVSGFWPADAGAPDGGFHYTVATEAVFQVTSPAATADVVFSVRARPYLLPPHVTAQPMDLWVNGVEVGRMTLPLPSEQDGQLRIPMAVWNRQPVVTIAMRLPNARSPLDLGVSGDSRAFGWAIRSMSFAYAD